MSQTLSGEDTLLCVFNSANNFTQHLNLLPAIFNKNYFRILSTRTCLLSVSFGKTPYILTTSGNLEFSNSFIAGDKTIWYSCIDQTLSTGTVILLDPIAGENLSVIFEFKEEAPREYYLE